MAELSENFSLKKGERVLVSYLRGLPLVSALILLWVIINYISILKNTHLLPYIPKYNTLLISAMLNL